MSQILTLRLNEQTFAAVQKQAKKLGISPEQLAAALLEQQFVQVLKLLSTDGENERLRSNFERHFGALDFPIDLDNENIDVDLATEYASLHEEA